MIWKLLKQNYLSTALWRCRGNLFFGDFWNNPKKMFSDFILLKLDARKFTKTRFLATLLPFQADFSSSQYIWDKVSKNEPNEIYGDSL